MTLEGFPWSPLIRARNQWEVGLKAFPYPAGREQSLMLIKLIWTGMVSGWQETGCVCVCIYTCV